MSEATRLFAGMAMESMRAYGLQNGEPVKKEGKVYRIPLEVGGIVEVKFERAFCTVGGMKRKEPTEAEVREVIEVLSGLEVSDV